MLNTIYTIATWLRRAFAPGLARLARDEARWRRDPLAHPALRRMSAHALDDLPLDRTLFGREDDDRTCLS